MFLQKPKAAHHLIEGPVAFAVAAIPIMDLLWTIEADAHHKIVLLEKSAPLGGEEGAVGLQRICYRLCLHEWFLKIDHSLEKIYSQKRRFPALPHELNDWSGLGCSVIGYEGGEDIIRHAVLSSLTEEGLLLEIKTVLTVKVAGWANRFGYDMDALAGTHSARRLIVLSTVLFCVCRHL
jgi:hypothetical protein